MEKELQYLKELKLKLQDNNGAVRRLDVIEETLRHSITYKDMIDYLKTFTVNGENLNMHTALNILNSIISELEDWDEWSKEK